MIAGQREQHGALTVQQHMRDIASLWPELVARVERGSGPADGNSGGNRPKRTAAPSPVNEAVIDVIAEISEWAVFLARVLMDEVTIERYVAVVPFAPTVTTEPWAPAQTHTDALLREIADTRVGHFTEHDDAFFAESVAEDAARLAKLALVTARPNPRRRIPLHIPCAEYGTSDMGERTPCAGSLYTTLAPDERLGDFVCDDDPSHRMTPLEWQRAQRHDPARDRDMDALLYGGRITHRSERIGA